MAPMASLRRRCASAGIVPTVVLPAVRLTRRVNRGQSSPADTPGGYYERMTELTYSVPGMHCGNCTAAVDRELRLVEGVESVGVDLDTKRVVVRGENLDDGALRAAIEEAGYAAA